MPRAAQSVATRMVSWFKTAPLPVAELVYGLVGDTMRARRTGPKRGRKPGTKVAKKKQPPTETQRLKAEGFVQQKDGSWAKPVPKAVTKRPYHKKAKKQGVEPPVAAESQKEAQPSLL